MALVNDRCICLRKVEYSETSQILTLLARRHGLLRVIAKGAHRRTKAGSSKFDGGIDFLDVGEAVFTDSETRDLNTLTEWKLVEGNLQIRKNLRGMYLGLYAAELLSLLIEERDPHVDLFDRLEASLHDLGTARNEETFLALQLDILKDTGHLPELLACVECGSVPSDRESFLFSPARGGVVCRNCANSIPDHTGIDTRLLRMMHGMQKLPKSNGVAQRLPRLTRHQTDPINRMLGQHIEHQLGKRLHLPDYVY